MTTAKRARVSDIRDEIETARLGGFTGMGVSLDTLEWLCDELIIAWDEIDCAKPDPPEAL